MKWLERLGKHLFTDYDNATWELGAFFIAISLLALIVFQAIDLAIGGHFSAIAFGGAVSAILGAFALYKIGDARGRIAADRCDQPEGAEHGS